MDQCTMMIKKTCNNERMNQFLKRIFYQFYVWGCKYNFANSPHLSAMYMLSLLVTLNLMSVLIIIGFLFGYRDMFFLKSKLLVVSMLVVVTTLIYFLYTRKKKYIRIFNEFDSQSPVIKKNIRLASIFFIGFTILILYGMAFIVSINK
jgi:hypothetical protein